LGNIKVSESLNRIRGGLRNALRRVGSIMDAAEAEKKALRAADKGRLNRTTQFLLSKEGLDLARQSAIENHLYYIHNARLKMIQTILPSAKTIIDLGGANSPLYEMGYPHEFEKLLMVDLPTDERHREFRRPLNNVTTKGLVEILYSDMTKLVTIENESFDLAWSGQSIEHITPEQANSMLNEVHRVLKTGGLFALDTPNRLITKIHTETAASGGYIHPDHKIEYYYEDLAKLLKSHGFVIEDARGICEMPLTYRTQHFHYEDFVLGSPISDRIYSSYILYFLCRKK
jgi:SAM-dependent methyltransferase